MNQRSEQPHWPLTLPSASERSRLKASARGASSPRKGPSPPEIVNVRGKLLPRLMLRTTGHQPAPCGRGGRYADTPLPNDPSLEHLRKQAKRLRKAVRAGESDALARVEEFIRAREEAAAGFHAERRAARHRAIIRVRELDEAQGASSPIRAVRLESSRGAVRIQPRSRTSSCGWRASPTATGIARIRKGRGGCSRTIRRSRAPACPRRPRPATSPRRARARPRSRAR